MLPVFVLSAHAFSNHKHIVCNSKVENHVHQNDLDCNLHLIKVQNGFLPDKNNDLPIKVVLRLALFSTYNFLINHQQLSFSLRGPPFMA